MLTLDKSNFEQEVLEAKGFVVVDFWSESCEPCKALLPSIEELAEKYQEQMKFAKLDTSKARRLAIKQKVLGLPTVVLYKDGVKVEEVTKDEANKENVEAMIQKHL